MVRILTASRSLLCSVTMQLTLKGEIRREKGFPCNLVSEAVAQVFCPLFHLMRVSMRHPQVDSVVGQFVNQDAFAKCAHVCNCVNPAVERVWLLCAWRILVAERMRTCFIASVETCF